MNHNQTNAMTEGILGEEHLLESTPLLRRHRLPAWLLSLAFHTVALVSLGLIFQNVYHGGAEEERRSGGIVLVNLDSETTEYLSEGDVTQAASVAEQVQASPPPLPDNQEKLPDLPGVAPSSTDLTGVGQDLIEALPGTDNLAEITTDGGRNVGGKVTTEVFGVKGTGSQFVYLFDRSASMEGFDARPLRAAKQQLIASLDSLGESHQFQMIFYNETTRVFAPNPGPATMVFANQETKQKAVRFVQSIRGDGGTDHLNGLKAALKLGPDVIFMLTDAEGGFTGAELSQIADWNRAGTVINTIEFGSGPKMASTDRSLERLAKQNRGQYVYKNIVSLAD